MATVSGSRVAEVFGVGQRRINQLVQLGMPKESHGKYDLGKCLLWYVLFLQKALARRDSVDPAELKAERKKLVAAQRVKVETGNAVAHGELLSLDDVRIEWTKRVANAQKRLRSIPASLGPQLTNKSDPSYVASRILEDINAALAELTNGGFDGTEMPL
jgi:phage terminase Nu1 subunit (DNA packaging protein)